MEDQFRPEKREYAAPITKLTSTLTCTPAPFLNINPPKCAESDSSTFWIRCVDVTGESTPCEDEAPDCRWLPSAPMEIQGHCPRCKFFPWSRLSLPSHLQARAEFCMQMTKADEQSAELAEAEESQRILRARKLGDVPAQDRLAAEAEEVEK